MEKETKMQSHKIKNSSITSIMTSRQGKHTVSSATILESVANKKRFEHSGKDQLLTLSPF